MTRLLTLMLLWYGLNISAQEATEKETDQYMQRLLLGIGRTDVLDTYLSPYSYKGVRFNLEYDREFSHTRHAVSVYGSILENDAGNVNEYDLSLRYSLAHLYTVLNSGKWVLKAGPLGHIDVGGIYNERNGNNPAQIKLSTICDAAARADYEFSIHGRPWQIEMGISIPVAGFAYSPQFGQSYYEQFYLGNYDHNLVFAHTFNTPSLRYQLFLDFPLFTSHAFVGLDGIIDQSRYNHLRYHSYSCSFTIGFKL